MDDMIVTRKTEVEARVKILWLATGQQQPHVLHVGSLAFSEHKAFIYVLLYLCWQLSYLCWQ